MFTGTSGRFISHENRLLFLMCSQLIKHLSQPWVLILETSLSLSFHSFFSSLLLSSLTHTNKNKMSQMSAAWRDGVRKADKANTNEKQIPPESHLRRTRAKYPSFTSEKTFLALFHAVVSQHAGGGCTNTLMHPKILLSALWSASHKSNHGCKVNIFFLKKSFFFFCYFCFLLCRSDRC